MNRLMLKSAVAALALAATMTGCSVGDEEKKAPVAAQDVANIAATRASALVTGVGASAKSVAALTALRDLTSSFNTVQSSFDDTAAGETCDPMAAACVPPPPPTPIAAPQGPTDEDIARADDELTKALRERIFSPENLESADETSATFLIAGNDLCGDDEVPADPECLSQVDKLELRIKASPVGSDSLDLTFIIGPARTEPFTLQLRPTSVAVAVDLAAAKAAAEHLVSVTGDGVQLPKVMEGKIELKLEQNGEQDYSLSGSVLAPVKVEIEEEGKLAGFSTAAAKIFALRLEGLAKRLSLEVDAGATEIFFPYESDNLEGVTTPLDGKRMLIAISGVSASFAATEGQQDFGLMHVGLGDAQSFVKLGDDVLFAADLNELSGRHFDVTFKRPAAGGLPVVQVVPGFDLVTKFFLAPLKADPYAEVDPELEDETYRIRLVGGAAPAVQPVDAVYPGFPGGLKVIGGTLTLESTKGTTVTTVNVPEGQCLVEEDVVELGAHPLLGHFAVQSCP